MKRRKLIEGTWESLGRDAAVCFTAAMIFLSLVLLGVCGLAWLFG